MKLYQKIFVAGIVFVGLALGTFEAYGATTFRVQNPPTGYSQYYTFFNATTTNATSTNIAANPNDSGYLVIAGAKKVELYFSRAATGTNNGASKFRVQVTPDGTNWYDFSALNGTDVADTGTSTVTITAATSTTVVNMELLKNSFYGVRCVSTFSIDGTETCKGFVEY